MRYPFFMRLAGGTLGTLGMWGTRDPRTVLLY
jgi:hypothetical protein